MKKKTTELNHEESLRRLQKNARDSQEQRLKSHQVQIPPQFTIINRKVSENP
jgi:hypothetical protein